MGLNSTPSNEVSKQTRAKLVPLHLYEVHVTPGTLYTVITAGTILCSKMNVSWLFSYLLLLGAVSEKKLCMTTEEILVKLNMSLLSVF
jgi:hypothetical protein